MVLQQEDRVVTRKLTLDHWPDDTGVPQPIGRFHAVAQVDWPEAVARIQHAAHLIHEPPGQPLFDRAMAEYERLTDVKLTEVASVLRPYLLVSNLPRSWLALPGTVTIYFPIRPQVDAGAVHEEFKRLMQPLVSRSGRSRLGVAFDPNADLYWLDSPMRQLFKAPAWGWSATPQGKPAAP